MKGGSSEEDREETQMSCLYRFNSTVSYQTNNPAESENLSKKRKSSSSSSTTLEVDEPTFENSPLPLEWQRCLDIESGQIHFYNTRTKKRTLNDPRRDDVSEKVQQRNNDHMSLDLELNLLCHLPNKRDQDEHDFFKRQSNTHHQMSLCLDLDSDQARRNSSEEETKDKKILGGGGGGGGVRRSLPWLAAGEKEERQEMVAAVCMRCHMLVVMCKSSPTCPNCKFMHPPDHQNPPFLLNNKRNCNHHLLC